MVGMKGKPRVFLLCLALSAPVWAGETQQPYRISTDVKGVENSPLQAVTSEAHYPYAPEKVWEVLTNFQAYAEFLPRVKECQSLGVTHGTEQIYLTFALPLPLSNLWNIVALTQDAKNHRFEWDLLAGNMNVNRGKLWVEPEAGGSVVRMEVQADVGFFLPQWVVRIGAKIFLPKVLRAFGDRIAELERARSKATLPLPAAPVTTPSPVSSPALI